MSQRKRIQSVEELASLPIHTLQAALKASEEREAERRRGERSRKRKLAERNTLEAKLREIKEELGEESDGLGGEESEESSEEDRPRKRVRKSATKLPVASASASGKTMVMSKRDACTWCRSHGFVCVWDGIGTRCTTCKGTKRGCDRWRGDDSSEPTEARTDLEKVAGNLERRLGRMEKIVDRIGQECSGSL